MTVATLATLQISGISEDGCGTASLSGVECRVPNAAPGDIVTVQLLHRSPHRPVAWAEIVAVDARGEMYREAPCPNAEQAEGQCGGCALMHLPEATQRALKHRVVNAALEPLGLSVGQIVASPSSLDYRNRANYVASIASDGRVILGSYRPRSHHVAAMVACRTVRPAIARLAAELESLCTRLVVPTYPQKDGLRYVTIRADQQGACLIDLIVNGETPHWLEPLCRELQSTADVHGVSWNVNITTGNTIRFNHSMMLFGEPVVTESVGSVSLKGTAGSFLQLNSTVAAEIYEQAAHWVGDAAVMWDLYCGAGGLGLTAAQRHDDARLYGAEVSTEAIELARRGAADVLTEATYLACDLVSEFPTDWPRPTVVFVNPPRRGIDPTVISRIVSANAQVLYMSCNPFSFARDAKILLEAGYTVTELAAWDMLPQTTHVELLASFSPAPD